MTDTAAVPLTFASASPSAPAMATPEQVNAYVASLTRTKRKAFIKNLQLIEQEDSRRKQIRKRQTRFRMEPVLESLCDVKNSIPYLERKLELLDLQKSNPTTYTNAVIEADLAALYDLMVHESPLPYLNAYFNFRTYNPLVYSQEYIRKAQELRSTKLEQCEGVSHMNRDEVAQVQRRIDKEVEDELLEFITPIFERKHRPVDVERSFVDEKSIAELRTTLATYAISNYDMLGTKERDQCIKHRMVVHKTHPSRQYIVHPKRNGAGKKAAAVIRCEHDPALAFLRLGEMRLVKCDEIMRRRFAASDYVNITKKLGKEHGPFKFLDNQLCSLDAFGVPSKIFLRVSTKKDDAGNEIIDRVDTFGKTDPRDILKDINACIESQKYIVTEVSFDDTPSLRVKQIQLRSMLERLRLLTRDSGNVEPQEAAVETAEETTSSSSAAISEPTTVAKRAPAKKKATPSSGEAKVTRASTKK